MSKNISSIFSFFNVLIASLALENVPTHSKKSIFLIKFSITLIANGSSSRIIQLIIVSILSVQDIYFFS